jgi:hypothetical protein
LDAEVGKEARREHHNEDRKQKRRGKGNHNKDWKKKKVKAFEAKQNKEAEGVRQLESSRHLCAAGVWH